VIFETGLISSPGGREDNEDFCGYRMADGSAGCWILADGLGGHGGGALAARTAVEAALAAFEADPAVTLDSLCGLVTRANQAVLDRQKDQPEWASMRTTLVMLAASRQGALWAHAGDSRLYHFRRGKVAAQTRDHSVPQRLADAGAIHPEQIRLHEDRNRLLRCLGTKPEPGASFLQTPVTIEPGDAFLLASDGFWEWILEPEMEQDLAAAGGSQSWLDKMEARLLARATPRHDNYSTIAVLAKAV
jgi:serine/threonine protein phosphatase PrpC